MEVAILYGVLKTAGKMLAPLLASEFASIMGVKEDLLDLQCLCGEITSWLSAVGDRATEGDPSFYWLKDLKDVSEQVSDLLFQMEAEKHKVDKDGGTHLMGKCFCTKLSFAVYGPKMANKIKEIKKKFAKVVKQRTDINAIENNLFVRCPVHPTNISDGDMSLFVNIDETKVIGRDEIKEKIIAKLTEDDTQKRISIVSIVGLGWSGKTTLAKCICQDNRIEEHFDVILRVHVSQEFSMEKLTGKLFESFSDKKSELHNLQHMCRTVSDKLSGKKFLLILDDIWNEDRHHWELFEQHFSRGAPGSKVLLTTRDVNVAEVVKSTAIFKLTFLSDDDSWKLFQQSSGCTEEGLDSELTQVGKEIVKKCAGVPKAIKSLAGVLHGKREVRDWRALRDTDFLTDWNILGRVLGSLRLSYFHLSNDLKHCTEICSIIPKGSRINRDQLISLWIVHGCVSPTNGNRQGKQQPEDIGSDYFDSLLKVCFLQDLVEDHYTGEVTCKMNDLVHDLTRQILRDEIVFTPQNHTTHHNEKCRYLSLASSSTQKVDVKLFKTARTLYVTGGSFETNKQIKEACCLRSVFLKGITDTSFPLPVLKFQYLAYLTISNVKYRGLPEAISDCWNLQALHVIGCNQFTVLPESIGKLKRLRTIQLLCLWNLDRLPHSIGDCHNLENLHLLGCGKVTQMPSSLRRNENLKVLIINCPNLHQLPSESFGRLWNLRTIKLSGCSSLEDLPSSFACDELHTLELHGARKLTVLPQCITSLSSLENLDLQDCGELVELPEGIGNLKRLQVLNLEGCCKLRGLPVGFGQLTRLRSLGLFVVGNSSEHARICELGNLDMISGVLHIEGITHVHDPGDAEKAYLNKKKNLHKLVLNGFSVGTDAEEEADVQKELGVLNGIEPPCGIKELEILNYRGLHLPCWIEKTNSCNLDIKHKQVVGLPNFPYLTKMVLSCFPKLKHFSGFLGLPSLKSLTLIGFDALESIRAGPFPSLTELCISGMCHLLELSTRTRITTHCNHVVQCCYPQLATLHIEECPKLNVNPCFPSSLESLKLERSNEQLLNRNYGASSLSLLKELRLWGMVGSFSASGWELLRHLTALKSLEIVSCTELRRLPGSMRSLTSLQELIISWCDDLLILPQWLGELSSLQRLEVSSCENLGELPEDIEYLISSVQELHIETHGAFHQLSQGLSSLSYLHVRLSCVPQPIRVFAHLRYLCLVGCTALVTEELVEFRFLQFFSVLRGPSFIFSLQDLSMHSSEASYLGADL